MISLWRKLDHLTHSDIEPSLARLTGNILVRYPRRRLESYDWILDPIDREKMRPTMQTLCFWSFVVSRLARTMAIDDSARLGTYLTGIPIYRTVGNTNTVQISLNGQDLNLTLCESLIQIGRPLLTGLHSNERQPHSSSQSRLQELYT